MNYWLLRLERSGKVGDVLIVDAADDQAALALAQSFGYHQALELWCGNRQIAVSKPTAAPHRMPAGELCA